MRTGRRSKRAGALAAALALLMAVPAAAAEDGVRIELNKLEQTDGACRAYLVFENGTDSVFKALKLDLVMFGVDGVIAKRLAVDGAPLPGRKTSVKLFDIPGLACAGIGQILLNDIMACRDGAGDRDDCVALVTTAARGTVSFVK